MSAKTSQILITVHGEVGIGKSAVALRILDALRSAGIQATWDEEQSERNMGTSPDDVATLEQKPVIRLVETNPAMGKSLADVFAKAMRSPGLMGNNRA